MKERLKFILKRPMPLLIIALVSCTYFYIENVSNKKDCIFPGVRFTDDFPSARLSACQKLSDNQYVLSIEPEDTPINDSPWYAFKINADSKRMINVQLVFVDGPARYTPKKSSDGKMWVPIAHEKTDKTINFSIEVSTDPVWVSAQEIVDNQTIELWLNNHKKKSFVTLNTIGTSFEGRNIEVLEANTTNKDIVVILGRQHPPEISGALALFSFVDILLGESELAIKFRQRFQLLIIPNVNPDGVEAGNWRHNMNGVDTNRDWGLFAQKETKAIANYLEKLSDAGHVFYLGIDFHSTGDNVFYTQSDEDSLCPKNFTKNWLDLISQTLTEEGSEFVVKRSPRTSDGNPTFKQWFNMAYGVPSISYEMADEIDRELIPIVAKPAAELMMSILLEENCSS